MDDAVETYRYLVTHRVPGPRSISYLVPLVMLPIALMIPSEKLSHRWMSIVFMPPIVASTVHAWLAMGGVDVITTDVVLWCAQLIWFENVRRVYKRMGPVDREDTTSSSHGPNANGDMKQNGSMQGSPTGADNVRSRVKVRTYDEPYPKPFWRRLRWVGTLIASTRMNSWKTGSAHHDRVQSQPRTHRTRTRFILDIIPNLLFSTCLLSLTTLFPHHDPYFHNPGSTPITTPYPSNPKPTIITLLQIIPPPILRPLIIGLTAYSMITLEYLLSPLAVLSNYLFDFPTTEWSPHAIVPYFGPFSTVLDGGITGLWGKWWHGHMRVMTSAPGVALGRALGLRTAKGSSVMGYALQVASAFLFSGITHMGLVPPEPIFAKTRTANELRLLVAGFFWSQGVGVLIEILVGCVVMPRPRTAMGRLLLRAGRLVWTIGWLCATLPLLAVPFAELGWWGLVPPGFPLFWLLG